MMLKSGDRVFAYNFNDNVIPGMKAEERGYWKDVGTIDSYYEANMDLIHVTPQLNLYNYKWPILTNQGNLPPAKTVFDDDDRRGQNIDSYVCGGCITSGSTVRRSIIGPLCKINSYSLVEDSILFDNVTIGRHVKIRRAIIDENVVISDGTIIGYDLDEDRRKGYAVTDSGIVVVSRMERCTVRKHAMDTVDSFCNVDLLRSPTENESSLQLPGDQKKRPIKQSPSETTGSRESVLVPQQVENCKQLQA